jgi:SAM-dependent methyltransferase
MIWSVGRDDYLLDNRQPEAGRRFDAIASLFDPVTCRHAQELGLAPGWRVWEVGAGGSSIADWFAHQVGVTGRVLASDIETGWMDHRPGDFEVVRHSVGEDPPPEEQFDLVHVRLVLVHLAHRERALADMVSVLRSGGWLLAEDADPGLQPLACPDERGGAEQLANKLRDAFRVLLAGRGVDLRFGRTLPRRLREAGLTDVMSSAYFPIGGPQCDALEVATVEQLRRQLVDGGHVTEAEVDAHLANVISGRLDLATSPLVSARGRKPELPVAP